MEALKKKKILIYLVTTFFVISSIIPSVRPLFLNEPVYASTISINPKGNVLFQDDFSRDNLEGWTVNGGTWAVENDRGNKVLRQKHTSDEAYIFTGDNSWTDYSIEAKIRLDDGGAFPGIAARVQDTNNFYYFQINKNSRGIILDKKVNGSYIRLAEADLNVEGNRWYILKLVLKGNTLTAYLDGKRVMRVIDNTFLKGRIGFRTRWGVVSIDDVIVTDERILYDDFEDKNLEGWTVEKGMWAVVRDTTDSEFKTNYVLKGKAEEEEGMDKSVLQNIVNKININTKTEEEIEGFITAGEMGWNNYWLQAKYMPLSENGTFGMVVRYQDINNHYLFRADPEEDKFELVIKQNGSYMLLKSAEYTITPLNWYVISVRLIGNTIQCYVNDQLVIQEKDSTYTTGKIGFYYENSVSYIDEVQAGTMEDPSRRIVEIDGRVEGRVFEGIGIVSGNNSSRLLMDYPEEQLEDIIDLLFKPNFGASLHSLKLEIGSDVNSSSGTEPSHMRSLDDFDITRGAGLWLAQKAKAVNPDLELEALRWGTPRFIGNNLEYKYQYYKSYLQGARDVYGLEFDYLAPDQNEGAFDRDWLVNVLAPRLKEDGFGHIKFVVRDAVSDPWAIVNDLERDPELYDLVSAIGVHYTTSSPPNAKNIGKPLWHSEAWPTFPSAGFRGERGVLELAKIIMDSYTNGKMTKYLMQPFVEAWYPIVPYNTKSGMAANKPWSGYYELTPGFWMIAHFTQFAKPGWIFLDEGCYSSATHNYITLKKPDGSGDYSIIIVNVTGEPQEYTFKLSGGLSGGTVHVWKTTEEEIFVHEMDIEPEDYTYTIVIEPYSVYSLTTTTGQQKGEPKHGIPEDRHLELPYVEDFDDYEVGKAPRYTTDQGGAFEVHEGGVTGKALRQVITADIKPIDWVYRTTPDPYTILGDLEWANYSVSCDVHLEGQSGESVYVIVGGRVIDSPGDGNPPISESCQEFCV